MNPEAETIPNPHAQVQAAWDNMAVDFAKFVEPFSVVTARSLIMMLELGSARSVLEVGAGAGAAAAAMAELLPPDARQVITDLSPVMIELARLRNPKAELSVASSEALPFEDAQFDRVLSSLNLMIAHDHKKALAETFRVLQPGGIAAWSVWGRPSHSPLMGLPDRALEKAGVKLDRPVRSNFHLGRRKKLIRHIEKAGFTQVLVWRQPMNMPFASGADFAASTLVTLPRLARVMAEQSESVRARYLKGLSKLADEVLSNHHPIGLELLMVVARKPPVYTDEQAISVKDEARGKKKRNRGEE